MPRVKQVTARKDYKDTFTGEAIKKGEKYYKWKFNFSRTVYRSKTVPKPQQLTKSGFQQALYDIQDSIAALTASESIADDLQSIIDEIQSLLDEQQSSLDNMPDRLQESSSSGQLLQERIDGLQNWIDELEGITTDVDEPNEEELKEELTEEEKALPEGEIKTRLEELKNEKLQEGYEEILEEIQNTDPGL